MADILNQPFGATPLTNDELQGLKVNGVATHGDLNEIEAVNIESGLTWLDGRPKTFDLLSDDASREIHRRLFGQVWSWAGQYRRTEKNIGVPVWQISTEMRNCLGDAAFWADSGDWTTLEAVSRFHHRLVWVHPFANGNGRWARIVTDSYLDRLDSGLFLDWSSAGNLQTNNEHRRRYINALQLADGYDFVPLIEFINSIVREY